MTDEICRRCNEKPARKGELVLCLQCFEHVRYANLDRTPYKKSMEAICPVCQNKFIKQIWNAKYCSKHCKDKVDNSNKDYHKYYMNRKIKENIPDRGEALRGKPSWNKGLHYSQERKEEISNVMKEKYASGYISPNLGRKHTEENIEKNRLGHLGQLAWNDAKLYLPCAHCGKEVKKKPAHIKIAKYKSLVFCNCTCKGLYQANPDNKENYAKHLFGNTELARKGGEAAVDAINVRFKEGKYYYNGIYYRSSWEAGLAAYFDEHKVKFEYGTKSCKFVLHNFQESDGTITPTVNYTCDFFVPALDNMLIEVKGSATQYHEKSIRSIKKFAHAKEEYKFNGYIWPMDTLIKFGIITSAGKVVDKYAKLIGNAPDP
jgi:hypothetical protein